MVFVTTIPSEYFIEAYHCFHILLIVEMALMEIITYDDAVVEAFVLPPIVIETVEIGANIIVITGILSVILLMCI